MIDFVTNFWLNKHVRIIIFDDGILPVSNKKNIWKVTNIKFNGDKLQLENCIDPTLKISSISAWKVRKIEKFNTNGYPE